MGRRAPLLSAGGYLALLRTPSVARLAVAFLALAISSTMMPVAFVLFARASTHSFASASLVLAASTAGLLSFGPIRGRLVDRLGPRTAVLRLAFPDIATDIAFIAAGRAGLAPGLLVGLAFVAGAVTAPATPALRSMWSRTLPGGEARQAGYALMSMLAETAYVAGPLVAGAAIALGSPTAAVATSAGLSLLGAIAFATAPDVRRWEPGQPRPGRLPALSGAGMRTMVATAATFGLTFGILDVAFPAFARAHGSVAVAGVLLSAFAIGSWVGGFLFGLRAGQGSAGRAYPALCGLAALGLAPLIATPGLVAMVALAVLSGLCFAPASTTQLAVLDEVTEPEHRAEALTWLGSLYGAGLATGAAVSGQLIAGAGVRAALGGAFAAAALGALIATARAGTLAPG
jgi:MFS family permease